MKRMVLAVMAFAVSTHGQLVELSTTTTGDTVRARLDWQNIPDQTYYVQGTPSLTDIPWTNMTPGGMPATNVIGMYEYPSTNRVQFFRIEKDDTDPPAVVELIPPDDAIAVVSNSPVVIVLQDETGIDTNSLSLNVAGWTNITVTDARLSYSNGTVTFLAPGSLGSPGSVISNSLTVSDTLGHTLRNFTWTFQLARPAVATNTFLPLTAPSGETGVQTLSDGTERRRSLPGVHPLDGTDEYHIISVTSNRVVFSYSGLPPAMAAGTHLVSFDAAYPFYRMVNSNMIDEGQFEITAWTTNIPLTELVSEGSISALDLTAAQVKGGTSIAAEGSPHLLHVEFTNDLSGTVLCEDTALKLHLPSASWAFVGDVDVAFDIIMGELRALDASAAGTLTLNMTPEVWFYQAISGGDSTPLVAPVTRIFGGMMGSIPVWVEVTMELKAGYEYSADVSGNAHTTINATKDLTFYIHLRENEWTSGADNPPMVLEADPLTWNLDGTANVKVCVQPKLTVLVYSLAGPRVDIKAYGELNGWYQPSPLEYKRDLYFGLSSTLGIESGIWYEGWGNKPEWTRCDQRWPLGTTGYPTEVAPEFVAGFPDRRVVKDNRLTLSGYASGAPTPAYTWYFNGWRIVGETGPEYVLASVQSGHQGAYTVQALNNAGTVETSCYVTVSSDTAPSGDYLVIDLSTGPSASRYPVSYLPAVPPGGWTDEYKTTKLVMRRIPKGTFTMGSPAGELGCDDNETQHQVTLTKDFYIGVFEVTQKQWERVMGNWPSWFTNVIYRDSRPVQRVSYNDIRENPNNSAISPHWPQSSQVHADSFMGKLRAKTGLTTLDLPTESQWEYACRAGTTTALNSGYNLTSFSQDPGMDAVGRYYFNGGSKYIDPECGPSDGTAVVGSYQANAWGLYDMHGNMWEWCLDWCGTYPGAVTNPVGAASEMGRVFRGGGWHEHAGDCRSADRDLGDPCLRGVSYSGFRLARTLP